VIDPDLVTPNLAPYRAAIAPAVSGATLERHRAAIAGARLVQLDFDEDFAASIAGDQGDRAGGGGHREGPDRSRVPPAG